MSSRLYTTIVIILLGLVSYAQEVDVIVQPDSTTLIDNQYVPSGGVSTSVYTPFYSSYIWSHRVPQNIYDRPLSVSPNFYDSKAVMPRIANLSGYVSSTSLPGLMGIESASVSYTLASGNLTFAPAVYVNKYGYFGGLTTSLGIGGQMAYEMNDNFSLTAFGAYHTNSWAANPAVMSNMLSSRYGAYGTWRISDRWSLSAGAQRVYNAATNHWQTVPIVMPSFKLSGKAAIGVDVGGLLYQIVDSYRSRKSYGLNPTIGHPVPPQM